MHMKYMLNFRRSGPINAVGLRKAYELHVIPGSDLQTWRNKENRWLQNRDEMQNAWFRRHGSIILGTRQLRLREHGADL